MKSRTMKTRILLAFCHAVAGASLLTCPTPSRAAQRIAGPELDGAQVRLEPRKSTPTSPSSPAGSAPLKAPPGSKGPRYDSLQLKGLAGAAGARFALINNQSFRSNDSAQVIVGDKHVLVQCLAIREKSVLVKVSGEPGPRELKLASLAPIPAFGTNAPPKNRATTPRKP